MWRDGTSHLLFEPIELFEKLAAIVPRPTINLALYHPAASSSVLAEAYLLVGQVDSAASRARRPWTSATTSRIRR